MTYPVIKREFALILAITLIFLNRHLTGLKKIVMVTIQEFNYLTDSEKIEAMSNAVFLGDRLTDTHYVMLYNYNNFYVEV